jgi:hypothetical protein
MTTNQGQRYGNVPKVRRRVYLTNNLELTDNLLHLWGSYHLEKRLANTTRWVYDFIDQLERTLLPEGVKEIGKLLAKGKTHCKTRLYRRRHQHNNRVGLPVLEASCPRGRRLGPRKDRRVLPYRGGSVPYARFDVGLSPNAVC